MRKRKPFRLLVTGSRQWTDYSLIHKELYTLQVTYHKIVLVSGHCPTGADCLAEEAARALDFGIEQYPADWSTYGKSAGFRRNVEMVESKIDMCYAFILDDSRGATHCMKAATWRKIPTTVWYRYS